MQKPFGSSMWTRAQNSIRGVGNLLAYSDIFTSSIDYKVVSSQTLMDLECYFESRFVPGFVIFAEAGCQGFPLSQISHLHCQHSYRHCHVARIPF